MAEEEIDTTSSLVSEVPSEESGTLSSRFSGAVRVGTVERLNLLNMTKLNIKSVIEFSTSHGTSIDDYCPPLQQLFILLEHILKHRLKTKRPLFGPPRKEYWSVVEALEKLSPSLSVTVSAVRALPNISTNQGRGRAWLRWSLMQKKLADFFRSLVEQKRLLSEWYDPEAFLLNEEGVVTSGLLMALSVLDYNVIMKGEDFDRSLGVIDLSQYLKEGNYLEKPPKEEAVREGSAEREGREGSNTLAKLMDQKAFLEERNKKLESMVERYRKDLSAKQAENEGLLATMDSLEVAAREATNDKEKLKIIVDRSTDDFDKVIKTFQEDREVERDALTTARSGLKDLYSASQKQLDTEMRLRMDLERQLEAQRALRIEKETALSLLEKDVMEKQSSLISLRKQLEEMKGINVKVQGQLQYQKQAGVDQNTRIKTLEGRVSQLSSQNKQLEHNLQQAQSNIKEAETTSAEMGVKMQQVQLERSNLEANLRVEKEWRMSLEAQLQKEKDRNIELQHHHRRLKTLESEHGELQERYATLQETVSEQEQALAEMAQSLSEARMNMTDMKHSSAMYMSQRWVDDSQISNCQKCLKEFSVARRKHHCRACGGIFCHSCSDHSMMLASSAKPVRVCDQCFGMLSKKASLTGASSSLSKE